MYQGNRRGLRSPSADPKTSGARSEASVALRHCLGQFVTGVTVVSFMTDEGPHGLTVNSFTSVSLDPPLVLICLDRKTKAYRKLGDRRFAINMLSSEQEDLAWHFAGKPTQSQIAWRNLEDGPCLEESLAVLHCQTWARYEAGDHEIVVGRVADFETNEFDALAFFRGRFSSVSGQSVNPESVA